MPTPERTHEKEYYTFRNTPALSTRKSNFLLQAKRNRTKHSDRTSSNGVNNKSTKAKENKQNRHKEKRKTKEKLKVQKIKEILPRNTKAERQWSDWQLHATCSKAHKFEVPLAYWPRILTAARWKRKEFFKWILSETVRCSLCARQTYNEKSKEINAKIVKLNTKANNENNV